MQPLAYVISALLVFGGAHIGREAAYPTERCHTNVACIEHVAKYICTHYRDRRHCQIWHHIKRERELQAHAASGPSGPWLRVAICEEGGRNDPTYGYLGILPSTWSSYGYSGTAGDASWAVQLALAERITGGVVPDASGCASW